MANGGEAVDEGLPRPSLRQSGQFARLMFGCRQVVRVRNMRTHRVASSRSFRVLLRGFNAPELRRVCFVLHQIFRCIMSAAEFRMLVSQNAWAGTAQPNFCEKP